MYLCSETREISSMISALFAIPSDWISALSSAVVALTALVALFVNKRLFVVVSVDEDNTQKGKKKQKTKKVAKKHRPWLSLLNLNIFRRSSMDKVFREAKRLANKMKQDKFTPTLIIFIGRGGAIFGSLISYNLKNAPIFCVDRKYEWGMTKRKVEAVFNIEIPTSFLSKVLLVAGEAHSGETMDYYYARVKEMNPEAEIKTCVFYMEDVCQMTIDYVGLRSRDHMLLPWQDASFIRDSLTREDANKLCS